MPPTCDGEDFERLAGCSNSRLAEALIYILGSRGAAASYADGFLKLALVVAAMDRRVDAPLLDAHWAVHGVKAARAQAEDNAALGQSPVQFFRGLKQPGRERHPVLGNEMGRGTHGQRARDAPGH